jgi:hypothetical protein
MFEIFKYRVLFTTFDIEKYVKIQNILKENNICFIHKTINNSHGNRTALGRLGENPRYSVEYRILVKNEDYEQAKFVTNIF